MRETPDLNAIRIFVAVADAGSFALAARTVGLSRSALGKAIVRLETRLGTRLLHRTTRRVTLTVDGAEYLARTRQILLDLDEAEASVRQDRPVPRGTLRLSLPGAFGRARILPVVRAYLRDWPELAAELSFTDRTVNLVEEGIDLAVRIGSRASVGDLVGRVVGRTAIVLCASPAYLSERGTPAEASELAGHERIHFGGTEPMRWIVPQSEGEPVLVPGPGRILVDGADAIRDLAIEGFGIAQLPRCLIEADLKTGRLTRVLAHLPLHTSAVSILYPNRRHLPVRVRLFIERLTRDLSGDQDAKTER